MVLLQKGNTSNCLYTNSLSEGQRTQSTADQSWWAAACWDRASIREWNCCHETLLVSSQHLCFSICTFDTRTKYAIRWIDAKMSFSKLTFDHSQMIVPLTLGNPDSFDNWKHFMEAWVSLGWGTALLKSTLHKLTPQVTWLNLDIVKIKKIKNTWNLI